MLNLRRESEDKRCDPGKGGGDTPAKKKKHTHTHTHRDTHSRTHKQTQGRRERGPKGMPPATRAGVQVHTHFTGGWHCRPTGQQAERREVLFGSKEKLP